MGVISDDRFDWQILTRLKKCYSALTQVDFLRPNESDFKFKKDKVKVQQFQKDLREKFDILRYLIKRIEDNPQPKAKGKIKVKKNG